MPVRPAKRRPGTGSRQVAADAPLKDRMSVNPGSRQGPCGRRRPPLATWARAGVKSRRRGLWQGRCITISRLKPVAGVVDATPCLAPGACPRRNLKDSS